MKKSLVTLLTLAVLFISCSEDNDMEGQPPELPPVESLSIDMSELEQQQQPKASIAESNFTTAYFSGVVIAAVLEAYLQLPKILLAAADGNSAAYLGDGEWEWVYSASGPSASYGVKIIAVTSDEDVEWNFYVSADNGQFSWDDLLLFSGTSTLDGSEGVWNIYNPVNSEVVTSASWNVTEESTEVNLTVYDGQQSAPQATIDYTFAGTTKTLVYANLEDDEQTTIEWDTETLAGFIISTNYNNGEKACWDEELNNTACPN